jgi:hypothetical protein
MRPRKTGRPKIPAGQKRMPVTVMLPQDVAKAFKSLVDKNRVAERLFREHLGAGKSAK